MVMGGEGIEKLFEQMGLGMEGVSPPSTPSLDRILLTGNPEENRFTLSCWLGTLELNLVLSEVSSTKISNVLSDLSSERRSSLFPAHS